jgi:pimeloyl-ACP methyl ester carboxylesterase
LDQEKQTGKKATMQPPATPAGSVQHVNISGCQTELRRLGRGRPLVFLHPGDGPEESAAILPRLAQRYDVFAPSHPGFGGSDLPLSFRTVDDLAYFYLDFLDQHDLHDAILLGVSFGGWIAAEIAIKSTARLSAVILADTVGAKFRDPRTREIADLFSIPQYEQSSLLYENAALRKKSFADLPDETLIKLARNHESFALFSWSPTLFDPGLARRLHRINVPTLVLWGSQDRVTPPDYGQRFAAAIPNAEFRLIDGAGHYAHLEQPDRFVSAVDGFIDALPAGR